MTQELLEYIINSDLPSFKKSELIKGLYDLEHKEVSMFRDGGKTSEENLEDTSDIIQYIKENYPILSDLADSTVIASNEGDVGRSKSYWDYVGGDIEFVPANLETNFGIEVRDEDGNIIEYNPYPGKRNITYNPNLAQDPDKLKNAVAMDLLSHGLREDKEYVNLFNQLKLAVLNSDSKWDMYSSFGKWLQKNGSYEEKSMISEYKGNHLGDHMFDLLNDKLNILLLDSFSRFADIYTDGLVRDFLSKNRETYHATPEQAMEENLKSDDSKKAWENLNNYIFKKQQGGTLDMTLEDILKLNISDSAKAEITRAFAEGGEVKEEKKLPEPDTTITIGDKTYDVCIADTEEKRKIGLSKCKKLPEDGGMLFVFDESTDTYFTMKETSIDLDIIFIDEEGVVIEVHTVEAFDPNPVECTMEYLFVLEVNANSGVLAGDELDVEDEEFTDEEKEQVSRSRMLVLNSDGDVQMKLVGGERIVSMIKTRQLIKAALKAYKTDNDSAYRRVGKLILTELNEQDNREPQYTSK